MLPPQDHSAITSKDLLINLNSLHSESAEPIEPHTYTEPNVDVCTIVVKNPAAKKYLKGSQANVDATQDAGIKLGTPLSGDACAVRGMEDGDTDLDDTKRNQTTTADPNVYPLPHYHISPEHTKEQDLQPNEQDNPTSNQQQHESPAERYKVLNSNFADFRKVSQGQTETHEPERSGPEEGGDKMDWDIQNGNLGNTSPKVPRKSGKGVKKKESFLKKLKGDSKRVVRQNSFINEQPSMYSTPKQEHNYVSSKYLKKKDNLNKKSQSDIRQDYGPQKDVVPPREEAEEPQVSTPRPAIDIPQGMAGNLNRNSTYTVNFSAGSQQYHYSTEQMAPSQNPPLTQSHSQSQPYTQPYNQHNYTGRDSPAELESPPSPSVEKKSTGKVSKRWPIMLKIHMYMLQ